MEGKIMVNTAILVAFDKQVPSWHPKVDLKMACVIP